MKKRVEPLRSDACSAQEGKSLTKGKKIHIKSDQDDLFVIFYADGSRRTFSSRGLVEATRPYHDYWLAEIRAAGQHARDSGQFSCKECLVSWPVATIRSAITSPVDRSPRKTSSIGTIRRRGRRQNQVVTVP